MRKFNDQATSEAERVLAGLLNDNPTLRDLYNKTHNQRAIAKPAVHKAVQDLSRVQELEDRLAAAPEKQVSQGNRYTRLQDTPVYRAVVLDGDTPITVSREMLRRGISPYGTELRKRQIDGTWYWIAYAPVAVDGYMPEGRPIVRGVGQPDKPGTVRRPGVRRQDRGPSRYALFSNT